MKGISVILCCYNSSARLPATLQHLSAQEFAGFPCEVILVDNNSTDNTQAVAGMYWSSNGLNEVPLRIIEERRPGLSFARSAGIENSRYEFVIFCDDDNWLESAYIQKAHNILSQDVTIGVLGGLNTAVADIEFPIWFQDIQDAYACGPQASQDGELTRQYVFGAGMVVRKEIFLLFRRIEVQSVLADRKGEELSSGGDSEICHLALMLGYKLFYSSELRLRHYMEAKRLKWDYLVRMVLGHAQSGYKLQYYMRMHNLNAYSEKWLTELLRIVKPLTGKRGVWLAYNYFKARKCVSNRDKIDGLVEFERILAHVRMVKSYSGFIKSLKALHNSIIELKAGSR